MADFSKSKQMENWEDLEEIGAKVLASGVTAESITNYYNLWATSNYDKTLEEAASSQKYGALKVLQQAMKDLFPTNRDKVVVLDVGAGTGLSGQMLRDIGFKVMDALDPAEEMLRVAQEKQIYRNTYICYLTGEPTDIQADFYDCVIMTGVVGHGCLPCASFEELTRMVKPGGYIINCMRGIYLTEVPDYSQSWDPLRARMEKEGRWRVLRMDPYPNHFMGNEGLLMVIQVLQ